MCLRFCKACQLQLSARTHKSSRDTHILTKVDRPSNKKNALQGNTIIIFKMLVQHVTVNVCY